MIGYITLLSLLIPALAAPVPQQPAAANTRFIVKLNPGAVTRENRALWVENQLGRAGQNITDAQLQTARLKWNTEVFDGFGSELTPGQLAVLKANPDVAWVKPDIEMKITEFVTQTDAPWGLSRISSFGAVDTKGGQLREDNLEFPFTFDTQAGAGVDVFVVDTGVRATHVDFENRAVQAVSFVQGEDSDGNGHGTHVAGTIGGRVLGVAKRTSIFGIKVMNNQGSGGTGDIIAGLNFIFENVQNQPEPRRPAVVNMSIGGPQNQALDEAAENLIRAGIHVVVAAGNSNEDANNASPARSPLVITVGATNINDEMADFSNFGPAVDVLAPGQAIASAGEGADDQIKILSGTSMASPHVAGLAAYLLGLEGQKSPEELKARIVDQLGRKGDIKDVKQATANTVINNGANPFNVTQTGTLRQPRN